MSLRYLFGPVTPEFADQNLFRQRREGYCLAVGPVEGCDIVVKPGDSWETLCAKLPADWRADFIALYLPYTSIPACLWSAPVPLVGLASDWNLHWHYYRHCLRRCELALTDTAGVEVMRREGIGNVRPANLYGCERRFLSDGLNPLTHNPSPPGTGERGEEPDPSPLNAGERGGVERDIDVLFVGNLQPAVQRERMAWLGSVARLSERWRVVIRMGVYGDEYRDLLRRARIVFNRSIRGEANRRVFEAVASGALLFQEAGNVEVPELFRHREECVYYTPESLECLLEYYLEREDERTAIAEAARRRAPAYSFEALWDGYIAEIEQELPALRQRTAGRQDPLTPNPSPPRTGERGEMLWQRVWQALGSGTAEDDPTLVPDLAMALTTAPQSAELHNALGLAVTLAAQRNRITTDGLAREAVGYFRRAVERDPGHAIAGLNLVEALIGAGQTTEAIEQARRMASLSHGLNTDETRTRSPGIRPLHPLNVSPSHPLTSSWLDAPHFPPAYDFFRVEWERAAWTNAGDPVGEENSKRNLVRWRLHSLLGALTGDLTHHFEATLARPILSVTRAELGVALARQGRFGEAARHLRAAVDGNPFDAEAARALFQVLGSAGDGLGQRRLASERRLLCRAAPEAIAAEPWFMEMPPAGGELASIIILCCNEVEFTRMCLESVLQHTRAPYELILVDNGSTDDTPAYLEEIRSQNCGVGLLSPTPLPRVQGRRASAPERVVVIRNETNVGFPKGCNQGLAQARGRYLMLLNNDTIVTRGWLEGLVALSLHDWPHIGLVGPVTNCASPPQQIPAAYQDQGGIDTFAERWRRENAGKALSVTRLIGFCLLIRREVLEKVGALDEQFGIGFFEDDDLCVRAQQAGYRLAVAQDVFIHHFGSRTFKGLGINCHKQLQEGLERFREKWGAERASGYRLPEQGSAVWGQESAVSGLESGNGELAPPPLTPDSCSVSLCMIVRNAESTLPASRIGGGPCRRDGRGGHGLDRPHARSGDRGGGDGGRLPVGGQLRRRAE
jgi:GT2 family glycosyltransferase